MLDINIIRSDPSMIRSMLANRNRDDSILDVFLSADSEWRSLIEKNNYLRRIRNKASIEISYMLEGK